MAYGKSKKSTPNNVGNDGGRKTANDGKKGKSGMGGMRSDRVAKISGGGKAMQGPTRMTKDAM